MRKVTGRAMACYFLLQTTATVCTVLIVYGTGRMLPASDFRGIALALTAVITFYACTIAVYRAFLLCAPLQEGPLTEGSSGEFTAHVHSLFFIIVFNSLVRTCFLSALPMRLVYLLLGARMGVNTYSVGALLDPALTVLGRNVLVGHNAVLFAHAIEGRRFAMEKIVVGDNVTIGAHAIVMAGVTIGDGALISAGAVVPKGTRIGAGETWGGVPARCLKQERLPVGTNATCEDATARACPGLAA